MFYTGMVAILTITCTDYGQILALRSVPSSPCGRLNFDFLEVLQWICCRPATTFGDHHCYVV